MATFYRAVLTMPASAEDFRSNKAKGKIRREPYESEEEWAGISVFDTEDRCRKKASRFSLGQYIAELTLPDNVPIRRGAVERSGHCTLWGEPEVFLRYMTNITPV